MRVSEALNYITFSKTGIKVLISENWKKYTTALCFQASKISGRIDDAQIPDKG